MRFLTLLPLALTGYALDNSVVITDKSGSTQTNRPIILHREFADGDICNYAKPYVSGSAASIWQNDNVNRWPAASGCGGGYLKSVDISFYVNLSANSSVTVDFRNSTDPCSSGNSSACSAAGLSGTAMSTATWSTDLTLTNYYGSGTCTFNPKTAISGGYFAYWLRGPAITAVQAHDHEQTLTYDCGFSERRYTRLANFFGATDTSFTVSDTDFFSTLTTPFTVNVDSEDIRVCWIDVATKTIYVGTTGGSSSSCADVAGRGFNSTTASYHSAGTSSNWVRTALSGDVFTKLTGAVVGNAQTTIDVVSTTGFLAGEEIMIDGEVMLILSKTATSFTVTRLYNGTGLGFPGGGGTYFPVGIYVWRLTGMTNRRILATGDTRKSLHPEALVVFAADSKIGVQYYVSNYWSTRGQDQDYNITITDTGSTIKSKTGVRHIWRTRWALPASPTATEPDALYWIEGSTPGVVAINHNLPYLKHAGVFPFDTSVTLSQTAIDNVLTNTTAWHQNEPGWDSSDKCEPDTISTINDPTWGHVKGQILRYLSAPGGRPEIGVFSGQFAAAALGWGSGLSTAYRLSDVAIGHGACSAQIPNHYREAATGLSYCNGGGYTGDSNDKFCTVNISANAFGRPISVFARPLATLYQHNTSSETDKFRPVSPVTANNFDLNTSSWGHTPALSFGAYFLTGRPFYRDEVLDAGGAAVFNASDYPYSDWSNDGSMMVYRGGNFGAFQNSDGVRTWAWAFRDVGFAWWAALDGSPEKEYFASVLKRNVAYTTGRLNSTNALRIVPPGNAACSSDNRLYSPWWWGFCAGARGWTGGSTTVVPFGGGYDSSSGLGMKSERVFNHNSPWMTGYALTSIGQIYNLGYTNAGLLKNVWGKSLNNRLTHTAYNPFLIEMYREPRTSCLPEGVDVSPNCSGRDPVLQPFSFTSFSTMFAAWDSSSQAKNSFTSSGDLNSGYARISRAAASFMTDIPTETVTGWRAWEWINGNVPNSNIQGDNPHWAFSPREQITNIRIFGNTLMFTAPDGAACGISWNPSSSLDSGDTVIAAGPRTRTVDKGARSPGDVYRITCTNSRVTGTLP